MDRRAHQPLRQRIKVVSKNAKPKRKYDPKRLQRVLVTNAVSRELRARHEAERRADAAQLSDAALQDLGIAYHSALVLMRQNGGEDHFHTLAAALNIAGRFCNSGIGQEFSAEITAGIAALERVRQRGTTTGRWVLDGDALNDISKALDVHDAQMADVTCGELRAAITEVYRLNELEAPQERLAA